MKEATDVMCPDHPPIQIRGSCGSFIATKPIEMVAMDLAMLERNNREFENVFVLTDVFSKYKVAVATKDEEATNKTHPLLQVCKPRGAY